MFSVYINKKKKNIYIYIYIYIYTRVGRHKLIDTKKIVLLLSVFLLL
ncbi:hypothetical protein K7X86_00610 [Candidatus Sulcia muelleri]|nr:hypothetical protein [Candidatus Karelsulcia muelleri]